MMMERLDPTYPFGGREPEGVNAAVTAVEKVLNTGQVVHKGVQKRLAKTGASLTLGSAREKSTQTSEEAQCPHSPGDLPEVRVLLSGPHYTREGKLITLPCLTDIGYSKDAQGYVRYESGEPDTGRIIDTYSYELGHRQTDASTS